jgi:hypothetical protein
MKAIIELFNRFTKKIVRTVDASFKSPKEIEQLEKHVARNMSTEYDTRVIYSTYLDGVK